ncbi:ATP-binding cassette domain-containing protein [Alphaproteobacteria bacterium GH1-50]|uniref:ATP-binding cassette domain-containing protein n=1 Tax=Kangsaoukella pontilimi TaxID=2691042 RepID=A0A7C9MUC5_9RHOB|nr:ABC transporter ATP-binding protein [Kangsaoukella pontilimi]MXQ06800.1 ATP-binding cassette domain-containing protein [Kangsaoukella pontilimi]
MLLDLKDIRKSFGEVTILDGVSLSLDRGETLALTGDSGSGKSTLLHIAGALEPFDTGEVLINGKALSGLGDAGRAEIRRDAIGLIFQQFNLIPSLDVAANIAFQARLAGREDKDWTAKLIERLGLSDHLGKYPEELSGGQQQRVAIGRALAGRPPLVLADEPTGNLDEATGDAVMDLLFELTETSGAGLLMVTHSPRLAARAGRRLHLRHGTLTE